MSEPIRVLQVFAQMNKGGAETMVMNMYRNIDRSKIQFDFVVHTEEECTFDNEIVQLGGRIYRVPRYIGRNHLAYTRAWNTFFRNNSEYKIIHGHVRSTASIYLKIAKKYGLKTIAHSHNTSSGNNLVALTKNILQFPLRNIADYLFACSKRAGEWLFGENINYRDNYYILKNAINTHEYIFNEEIRLRKRQELGLKDRFVVGHVGRFNKQKNHKFLIDIFKSIHELDDNSVLILAGSGPLKSKIEKKVNSLNLSDSVLFLGVRSDVRELLQAMDVFLFPSL
jgi:glycosyltransferase involved in cell wall biosynthesis